MDEINWVAMLVALGLGTLIATIFMLVGTWMDRRRIAQWDRELNDTDNAPRDIVRQRDGKHDADGA